MSDVATEQSASQKRLEARLKKDEEELAKLMEQTYGAKEEAGSEEEAQDAQPEVESDTPPEPAATTSSEQAGESAEPQKLSKEEETFKKRYGDLRRHMQEKEDEWKKRFDSLEEQLNKAAKNELVLPKSDADIEAWTKQYPDVAAIVEAIADKKAQERSSELDGRLKEIEELRVNAKREKAEAELLRLHPDFIDIRNDDAFHDWAEEQPKWVQDALYENTEDAKAVARVLDLYKIDKGISKKPSASAKEKDAAASVKGRNQSTPTQDTQAKRFSESQVYKMSEKEYEKNQDAIMEAMRNGTFVYDMSK
jgi:hypothetical protein